MRPVTLEPLKHASFRSFAWANPDELPGGNGLSTHKELNWSNGAFIYEFTNGQAVFYRVLPTSDGAKPALYADGAKEMAEAFTTVRSMFEQACVDAVRLARDIDLESRSPITTWLGAYGILIPAFYVIGAIAFGYLEEFNTLDTLYFLTTTVTTVGYGDLTPQTPYGRLLTAIMAPLGCVVVMGGLVPIVNSFLYIIDGGTAAILGALLTAYRRCTGALRLLATGSPYSRAKRHGRSISNDSQSFPIHTFAGSTVVLGYKMAALHALLSPPSSWCHHAPRAHALSFAESTQYIGPQLR